MQIAQRGDGRLDPYVLGVGGSAPYARARVRLAKGIARL